VCVCVRVCVRARACLCVATGLLIHPTPELLAFPTEYTVISMIPFTVTNYITKCDEYIQQNIW